MPDQDRKGMTAEYNAERDERRRREVGSDESVWNLGEKAAVRACLEGSGYWSGIQGRE